jgi:hypothetical protein
MKVSGDAVGIAWRDDCVHDHTDIVFRGSQDGGATLNPPIILFEKPPGTFVQMDLRVAVNGTVAVVWRDEVIQPEITHSLLLRRSLDDGVTFEPLQQIMSAPGGSSRENLEISSEGLRMRILWMDAPQSTAYVFETHSDDSGATFSPPLRISGPEGGVNPAFVASGQNVYAAWTAEEYPALDIRYRASYDNGITWDPPLSEPALNISDDLHISSPPQIALGSNVYMMWYDTRQGDYTGSSYEVLFRSVER